MYGAAGMGTFFFYKKNPLVYRVIASFQAQYANVVATLDDYDTDKEAEKQRVKQMLKDLDESFSKKEGLWYYVVLLNLSSNKKH